MLLEEKSKVQIRPHSIKSVGLVLMGPSARGGGADSPKHNML